MYRKDGQKANASYIVSLKIVGLVYTRGQKKMIEKLWNNESGSNWYKKYHESWKNKNAETPRIYELYEILIALLI